MAGLRASFARRGWWLVAGGWRIVEWPCALNSNWDMTFYVLAPPASQKKVHPAGPLARSIAARCSVFPQVTAIALAVSEGAGEADPISDIGLCVYADAE